jgi:hypothetical protein
MSERTLSSAITEYMEHLKAEGKADRTIYTYKRDAEQIISFFGPDRKLSGILVPHVGKFLKSDALTKLPSGRGRAEPTIKKTIRFFRMFLCWTKEMGYISRLPLPKDVTLGKSVTNTAVETQQTD